MPVGPVALVTPISLSQRGNGLAHRARTWRRALAQLGEVTVFHVPVAGEPHRGDERVVRLATSAADLRLPRRASTAPEWLGRGVRDNTATSFRLVVAFRADVAPFALGLTAGTGAAVVVDLDDDDVAFHAARGDLHEAQKYRSLRDELLERADLVTAVTGAPGVLSVPNAWPVGSTAFRPTGRPRADAPPQLLMVGNFGYAPNLEGARWFTAEVLPLLRRHDPRLAFVAVGPGSEALRGHGLGFVPDLAPHYDRARAAVVPLHHGSGSRIKALEAFARGVPVVGTTLGMAGLDVVDGEHCLLADDAPTFARQVVRVLEDRQLAAALAQAARSHAADAFDQHVVEAAMAAHLRAVLDHRREPVLRRAAGLLLRETEGGMVVADQAGTFAHNVAGVAAAALALAEEPTSPSEIADALADVTDAPHDEVAALVRTASEQLLRAGLLVELRQHAQGG